MQLLSPGFTSVKFTPCLFSQFSKSSSLPTLANLRPTKQGPLEGSSVCLVNDIWTTSSSSTTPQLRNNLSESVFQQKLIRQYFSTRWQIRLLLRIYDILAMSLLLPLKTHTTVFPFIYSFIIYRPLKARAPAGSAIICSSLKRSIMNLQAKPQSTSLMGTSSYRIILKVLSPVFPTAAPSIKFQYFSSFTGRFSLSELYMLGHPFGSNPIILVSGEIDLRTMLTPDSIPPPPTQQKKQSMSLGIFQTHSMAIVPCPMITFSSLKGCTSILPWSLSSLHFISASLMFYPCKITSTYYLPQNFTFSTFI